ncbi:rust resistance kinase Lr10-like [Zingiber officinale]|uniref:rust resistance kinase Lr10-like n=1 Tax=Zingiber officinale TaxID=94328 RepID=UPI001C4DC262|nr:rust resistance kinase Lr10-like [Zingiber officinale]
MESFFIVTSLCVALLCFAGSPWTNKWVPNFQQAGIHANSMNSLQSLLSLSIFCFPFIFQSLFQFFSPSLPVMIMEEEKNPYLYSSLFSLLFVFSNFGEAAGSHCPSFSCGRLHNLSHPFRRKGDPSRCGRPAYELNCAGDEAVIHIGAADYYVTQVDREHYYDEMIGLSLVDPNFSVNGTCHLPSQTLLQLDTHGEFIFEDQTACFMNCTKEIHASSYVPVPCLSSHSDSSFTYVVVGRWAYELRHLQSSCKPLACVPVLVDSSLSYPSLMKNISAAEVHSILQKGFRCYTIRPPSLSVVIRRCLNETFLRFSHHHYSVRSVVSYLIRGEIRFFDCAKSYFGYSSRSFKLITVAEISTQIVLILIALMLLGRYLLAPMIVLIFLAYKLWLAKGEIDIVERFLRNHQVLVPKRYAYSEIVAITRHFRDKLGQGGFGSVFKGELPGGVLVAVKLLGDSKLNGDDFINEVSTIGKIHHVHVVRLVGFCAEDSKRALVYEYMVNGSLDKYIFANRTSNMFTSNKLIEIATGIARGIDYLHRGCEMQILHFDIKPHNILLDRNFNPKIADFGLAKLYPRNKALVSVSVARGTIGYIAPELISRSFGVISYKADVYSFGMLLLEMAGKRRNVNPHMENSSQVYYPSWIYDKLSQLDEARLDNTFEIESLEKKLALIGLWCIQTTSYDRPTMSRVLEMLETDVETLPLPPKPFHSSTDTIPIGEPCSNSTTIELESISE